MSSIFVPFAQRQPASRHHLPSRPRKTVMHPAKAKPLAADLPVASVPEIEAPKGIQMPPTLDPVLRLPKVLALTGCAESTWHRYVKLGLAPRGRRLGPNTVGWLLSDIQAWLQSRPLA
jgi:prophage regulatory protein